MPTPFLRRNFESIAQKLSLALSEDVDLTEKVSRWLWAYTPPLGRKEIAAQLEMSERSLARKLRDEGTSFKALYHHVQTERAKNLLRNESLTISTIAQRHSMCKGVVHQRVAQR